MSASIIDIISPCVTFNNHDSSTKSYKNAKDHDYPLHDVGFVQYHEVEDVEIERRNLQYLYDSSGRGSGPFVFMNSIVPSSPRT